jgi:hypothetical protein
MKESPRKESPKSPRKQVIHKCQSKLPLYKITTSQSHSLIVQKSFLHSRTVPIADSNCAKSDVLVIAAHVHFRLFCFAVANSMARPNRVAIAYWLTASLNLIMMSSIAARFGILPPVSSN